MTPRTTLQTLTPTLTGPERAALATAINTFGDGQHPEATEASLPYFTLEYARRVLDRVLDNLRPDVATPGTKRLQAIRRKLVLTHGFRGTPYGHHVTLCDLTSVPAGDTVTSKFAFMTCPACKERL